MASFILVSTTYENPFEGFLGKYIIVLDNDLSNRFAWSFEKSPLGKRSKIEKIGMYLGYGCKKTSS